MLLGGSGFALLELVVASMLGAGCHSLRVTIVRMAIAVRVVMTFATSCNSQCLVHSHKRKETNHNTHTKEEIPVRFDHDESHMLGGVLAQEDLREEVEECVT